MRILSWFSCGAASAVATKLTIETGREVLPVYCETGAEHKDNERFLADCEKWFGTYVYRLKSEKFEDTWDVWERRKYLAGIDGAPCTVELKIHPRLSFQKPDDIHVFGYTADKADIIRANRLRLNYPELRIETPLITAGLTKESVIAMIERANIAPPPCIHWAFKTTTAYLVSKLPALLIGRWFANAFQRNLSEW